MKDRDLITFLERTRDWGFKTFGPGERRKGVCDHIRRELAEIEARPSDPIEWADVALLASAGAWRAGIGVEVFVNSLGFLRIKTQSEALASIRKALEACESGDLDAWIDVANLAFLGLENLGYSRPAAIHLMMAKQMKNECRAWPDWRTFSDGEVIEHVRR